MADGRVPTNDPRNNCGTHFGSRGPFLESPDNYGPVKLLLFTRKIEVSIVFASNMIKLSVNETKRSS